jgi:hypothetical protein
VIDGSGVEMIVTTDLRTYDASTLVSIYEPSFNIVRSPKILSILLQTLGDGGTMLPDIPAGQSAYHVEITCPSECTETLPHEIHVFSDYFHMHEIGKSGFSWIHRGDESILLNRIEYYAFANQHAVAVNITLKPGDRINTNCVWDSSKRTAPTNIAVASTDEMCMEFLTYYPAIPNVSQKRIFPFLEFPLQILFSFGNLICTSSFYYGSKLYNRTSAILVQS